MIVSASIARLVHYDRETQQPGQGSNKNIRTKYVYRREKHARFSHPVWYVEHGHYRQVVVNYNETTDGYCPNISNIYLMHANL